MAGNVAEEERNVIELDAGPAGNPAVIDRTLICDEYFLRDLDRLKKLRAFVQKNNLGAAPSEAAALSFGRLNMLRYDEAGRPPTEAEWAAVDVHTQTFFGLLSEPLRRRFTMGELPWWLSGLPLIFIAIGVISLVMSVVVLATLEIEPKTPVDPIVARAVVMAFYLFWLMSLGAIGAVAFIAMNALSVQEDVTFDLTNTRLMWLRLVLGALFGLVLTLPLGFEDFIKFCTAIIKPSATEAKTLSSQTIMLLLPFILGFSTSLVILILNQFVEAVQSFFGRRPPAPAPVAVLPTSNPAVAKTL